MNIHPELVKLTTVAGSASGNTQKLMGLCYQILVKPATSTTSYDISFVDETGITVYERLTETGTLSEINSLPMKGVYTISLANATANELIVVKLLLREE